MYDGDYLEIRGKKKRGQKSSINFRFLTSFQYHSGFRNKFLLDQT
ncbi:hypothetical protein RCH19_002874 [Flavobacterium sp. PL12]